MEEEEKNVEKENAVKMGKVLLGFFPTAVTEEQLEEAREKSIQRIFGQTKSLQYVTCPNKVGTFDSILQKRVEEHCQEGKKYFSQGEWEKAVTCYTKALNLDPNKVELYTQKAEAFIQLCDFQSAALHLQRAYFMTSRDEHLIRLAFVLHVQGQCLYEQNAYLDALESFTRASELQPQNVLYCMRSIACLGALKRYNDCLQMVNKEVAREKKNPDLFVLRARLYDYFGKATLSYYNVQEALALDPDHSGAQILLDKLKQEAQKSKDRAVRKAVKGNLKGALVRITRAIEYSPKDADYFLLRGSLLRRLKDFSAAIDDYLKAVALCKEEEGNVVRREAQKQVLLTYNDFAVHCYSKGFYEEAVLLLNKAIKGEKAEKGLYINRGDCFLKLGEFHFAMADYQQALELKPLDVSLQRRVAWLYDGMGLQEFRERRYPQAEQYFSHAIEYNPRELKYYLHRAKNRMLLQEVLGAKEDVITAILLDPKDEEAQSSANHFFPGEPISVILSSKVGELAKALLDQRLEARPDYEALADHERLEPEADDQPKDVYVQNEEPEKEEKQDSEEKRLHEKLATCQKTSRKRPTCLTRSSFSGKVFHSRKARAERRPRERTISGTEYGPAGHVSTPATEGTHRRTLSVEEVWPRHWPLLGKSHAIDLRLIFSTSAKLFLDFLLCSAKGKVDPSIESFY